MAGWIETSNGIELPAPELGSGGTTISTFVDGGRNTNGDFIGAVVGEDKLKIECNFRMLSPEEMMRLLGIFDRSRGGHFVNTFKVFDPRVNDFRLLRMYVGDRSGTPYNVNKYTLRPEYWDNVTANLIQV